MAHIILPATLDRTAAGVLAGQLEQALSPGAQISLAGGAVSRIGQSGLQMLLAAQISAAARAASLEVMASPAMIQSAKLAGLADTFVWREASHDQ